MLICLMLTASTQVSAAQSPAVNSYICDNSCRFVASAPARPVKPFIPSYPTDWRSRGVESLVALTFDIGADGHTSNIALETLFGPKDFADATIEIVRGVLYVPRSEDGVPVVTHRQLRLDTFQLRPRVAHPDFVAAVQYGQHLLAARRLQEAAEAFKKALEIPANLEEYASATRDLADIYMQMHQSDLALRTLQSAELIARTGALGDALKAEIAREHMMAAAAEHYYSEAADSYAEIQSLWLSTPDDNKAFVDIKSELEGAEPITIHVNGPGAAWQYSIIRNRFSIGGVHGSINYLTVYCKEYSASLPSGNMLQLQLPAGWHGCRVHVDAAPGTTFDLIDG